MSRSAFVEKSSTQLITLQPRDGKGSMELSSAPQTRVRYSLINRFELGALTYFSGHSS